MTRGTNIKEKPKRRFEMHMMTLKYKGNSKQMKRGRRKKV